MRKCNKNVPISICQNSSFSRLNRVDYKVYIDTRIMADSLQKLPVFCDICTLGPS